MASILSYNDITSMSSLKRLLVFALETITRQYRQLQEVFVKFPAITVNPNIVELKATRTFPIVLPTSSTVEAPAVSYLIPALLISTSACLISLVFLLFVFAHRTSHMTFPKVPVSPFDKRAASTVPASQYTASLETENAYLRTKLANLEIVLDSHRLSVAEHREQAEGWSAACKKYRAVLRAKDAGIAQLQNVVEDLTAKNVQLDTDCDMGERACLTLQVQLRDAQREIRGAERVMRLLEAETMRVREEVKCQRKGVEMISRERDEVIGERTRLVNELRVLKVKNVEMEGLLVGIEACSTPLPQDCRTSSEWGCESGQVDSHAFAVPYDYRTTLPVDKSDLFGTRMLELQKARTDWTLGWDEGCMSETDEEDEDVERTDTDDASEASRVFDPGLVEEAIGQFFEEPSLVLSSTEESHDVPSPDHTTTPTVKPRVFPRLDSKTLERADISSEDMSDSSLMEVEEAVGGIIEGPSMARSENLIGNESSNSLGESYSLKRSRSEVSADEFSLLDHSSVVLSTSQASSRVLFTGDELSLRMQAAFKLAQGTSGGNMLTRVDFPVLGDASFSDTSAIVPPMPTRNAPHVTSALPFVFSFAPTLWVNADSPLAVNAAMSSGRPLVGLRRRSDGFVPMQLPRWPIHRSRVDVGMRRAMKRVRIGL